MNSTYIYAVVKRGKYLEGASYCTGHKANHTWTSDPRKAVVMWKARADDFARITGGKVQALAHLQPQEGQHLYRLENDLMWDGEGGMKIAVSTFLVERRTPRGAWVRKMWPNGVTGKMEAPSWEKRRFILDGTGKRHAYALMEDALESFRARKERQAQTLELNLLKAKAALEILDRPDFEVGKVFYVPSIHMFREY